MTKHPKQILIAKSLRKNMTDIEKRFWNRINRNQLGVKFRRQQPIGPYIVDFICHSKKLVIELDGNQHLENIEYDNKRTEYIVASGYDLIRIPNSYLSYEYIEDVIHSLYCCLNGSAELKDFFISNYENPPTPELQRQ